MPQNTESKQNKGADDSVAMPASPEAVSSSLKFRILNWLKDRRVIAAVVLVVLIGISLYFFFTINRSDDSDTTMDNQDQSQAVDSSKAPELRDDDKYIEAAEVYEASIDQYSDEQKDVIYQQVAQNYFDGGNYAKAAEYYKKLVEFYNANNEPDKARSAQVFLELAEGQFNGEE